MNAGEVAQGRRLVIVGRRLRKSRTPVPSTDGWQRSEPVGCPVSRFEATASGQPWSKMPSRPTAWKTAWGSFSSKQEGMSNAHVHFSEPLTPDLVERMIAAFKHQNPSFCDDAADAPNATASTTGHGEQPSERVEH